MVKRSSQSIFVPDCGAYGSFVASHSCTEESIIGGYQPSIIIKSTDLCKNVLY